MRYIDMQGVGVKAWFPNEVSFIFSPQIVRVENNREDFAVALTVSIDGENWILEQETDDGIIIFDIRRYLQASFGENLSDTYAGETAIEESKLSRRATITLSITNTTNGTISITEEMLAVWGALDTFETIPKVTKIPYFQNLPFSFGYIGFNNLGLRATFEDGTQQVFSSGEVGDGLMHIYNLSPAFMFPDKTVKYIVSLSPSVVIEKDMLSSVSNSKTYEIVQKECTKGVYLRWIDRQGMWRYWLFTKSSTSEAVEVAYSYQQTSEWPSQYYDGVNAYNPLRQTFSTTDTISLAAPNIEEWELSYISTIGQSPVVHLYDGDDWVLVSVMPQNRTFAKGLQDYSLTVQLPKKNTQEV